MASYESWEEALSDFKFWYTAVDGFGVYLRHFLAHYGHFFRDGQETHLFVYSKLHKEFSENLERAVNAWLASKSMTDSDLESMLNFAKANGDEETDGIVDAMITMLEYHSWITYITGLKKKPEVAQLLEDQWFKSGWEKIGDSEVHWNTSMSEAWTDQEWNEWIASREQWSDEEWEQWWAEQAHWDSNSWEGQSEAWANKSWTAQAGYEQMPAPVASAGYAGSG